MFSKSEDGDEQKNKHIRKTGTRAFVVYIARAFDAMHTTTSKLSEGEHD